MSPPLLWMFRSGSGARPVKRLCRDRGASVMLITHDMGVIAETTDRVAVLYAGRLQRLVTQILRATQSILYRGLIALCPPLSRAISGHIYSRSIHAAPRCALPVVVFTPDVNKSWALPIRQPEALKTEQLFLYEND